MRGLPIAIVLAAAALALANAGRLNPYWTHVAIIAMYYGSSPRAGRCWPAMSVCFR